MKNDFVEAGVVGRWKKVDGRDFSSLRYQDVGEWAESKENSKITWAIYEILIP